MKRLRWPIGGILLVGLLACTLGQAIAPPTPFPFPTPNLTLTALFNPTQVLPTSGVPTSAPPTAYLTPTTALPTSTPPPTPTAPPPPTPSPSPLPSPTLPPTYPDREPRVYAPLAATGITLDGDWSEWPVIYNYVLKHVVYGADHYSGPGDLSGIYRLAWDATYLYIGVRIGDDRYVQEATGAALYKGDSLEIQVDTNRNGDYFVTSLNNDDFQLGFSAGKPFGAAPEAYRWYPAPLAGPLPQVSIAAQDLGGAHLLEIAVPWSVLQVQPYQGLKLGFCLSLSDNDHEGVQEQQTMLSNCPRRRLTDPTTWGTLILRGAP